MLELYSINQNTHSIHNPTHLSNEQMMNSVRSAMADVDLMLLIVDSSAAFGRGDEFALELLNSLSTKKILLLNKIDQIAKKELLPIMDRYSRLASFEEIVPISALTGENVEEAVRQVFLHL